jgi:6-phosphogluconolactonase
MKNALWKLVLIGFFAALGAACSAGGDDGGDGKTPKNYRYCLYSLTDASKKISVWGIDAQTGGLEAVVGSPFDLAREATGIAADPSGRFLYLPTYEETIIGLAIKAKTGVPAEISGSPFPVPEGSLQLAVAPSGRFLYSVNTYAWSVSVHSISAATGALTEIGAEGTAAYPLSFAMDPLGRFLYLNNTSDFNVYDYAIDSATGMLTPLLGSPFDLGGWSCALAIDPLGRFLYVWTALETGYVIRAFAIDAATGVLTLEPGMVMPGGEITLGAFAPSGRFVYSPRNDVVGEVAVFAVDESTGALTEIAGSPFFAGQEAESVAIDPTGKFLYVTDRIMRKIVGFSIDADSGALTALPGSPFPGRLDAAGLTIVPIIQ